VGPAACLEAFEQGYETSGTRHSLLSQFFSFIFSRPSPVYCGEYVYVYVYDFVEMYKNYRWYEITL